MKRRQILVRSIVIVLMVVAILSTSVISQSAFAQGQNKCNEALVDIKWFEAGTLVHSAHIYVDNACKVANGKCVYDELVKRFEFVKNAYTKAENEKGWSCKLITRAFIRDCIKNMSGQNCPYENWTDVIFVVECNGTPQWKGSSIAQCIKDKELKSPKGFKILEAQKPIEQKPKGCITRDMKFDPECKCLDKIDAKGQNDCYKNIKELPPPSPSSPFSQKFPDAYRNAIHNTLKDMKDLSNSSSTYEAITNDGLLKH